MKIVYLDFEFRGISEPRLDLVSVSAVTTIGASESERKTWWLHNDAMNKDAAREFFAKLIEEGYVFVSYVIEAEVRSLLSLFGEDHSWTANLKAIDLYLEYRCLLNHHDRYAYGEQYIDGKVVVTKPPKSKWVALKDDDDDLHHKPSYSLAAACYKLLGEKVDTVEKNEVRDIIIHGTDADVLAAKERILRYNESDIVHLQRLLARIGGIFVKGKGLQVEEWKSHALARGDYAVRTARMVALGYPVNMAKVSKFTSNIKNILKSAAEECLEVAPEVKSFRYNKKMDRYTANEKEIREWVKAQSKPYWRQTDGGKSGVKMLSLSKDAFKDWYDSESSGFAGAYCRYLKTKQSLNGFLPGSGKKGVFTDFVGQDDRARPFFGIYGSQSSRSQPGATGFIPLKAHWMRNFIEPKLGKAIVGLDFASQEFLIAAILSQDSKMIEAYSSGDVYLAFAKEAGLVPKSATKESHKKMRDVCKALVLGISYDMSARGLAPRLTSSSGEEYTEAQAENLIQTFYNTYYMYSEWKKELLVEYEETGRLFLSDGWVMWGDNRNHRSVGNFPVQGTGAVIMRESVKLAQDRGLDIIFTLHDALYAEFHSYDTGKIILLQNCMQEAFFNVMSKYGRTIPIRIEGEAWSSDYAVNRVPDVKIPNVEYLPEYIDAKGKSDLERYRKFFT